MCTIHVILLEQSVYFFGFMLCACTRFLYFFFGFFCVQPLSFLGFTFVQLLCMNTMQSYGSTQNDKHDVCVLEFRQEKLKGLPRLGLGRRWKKQGFGSGSGFKILFRSGSGFHKMVGSGSVFKTWFDLELDPVWT